MTPVRSNRQYSGTAFQDGRFMLTYGDGAGALTYTLAPRSA